MLKKKGTVRRKLRRTIKTCADSIMEKYKSLRNTANKLIKNNRENFFASMSKSLYSNPKRFWSFFKTTTKSCRIPQQVSSANGTSSSRTSSRNAQETANLFNYYFNSVFLKESDENYHPVPPVSNDTVDHTILLSKLESCGVRGTPLRWFQSYLYQRKQVCKINNTVSNETDICCGVPQGSNRGPLLFLVYINDLPNCLQTTEASMFNTNLSGKGQTTADVEYKLKNDLKNIRKWLISNKLTLNRKRPSTCLLDQNIG